MISPCARRRESSRSRLLRKRDIGTFRVSLDRQKCGFEFARLHSAAMLLARRCLLCAEASLAWPRSRGCVDVVLGCKHGETASGPRNQRGRWSRWSLRWAHGVPCFFIRTANRAYRSIRYRRVTTRYDVRPRTSDSSARGHVVAAARVRPTPADQARDGPSCPSAADDAFHATARRQNAGPGVYVFFLFFFSKASRLQIAALRERESLPCPSRLDLC